MSSSVSVILSREQAAILLPLLQTAAPSPSLPTPSVSELESVEPPTGENSSGNYTNAEMFLKKKKNSRSTAAQNYFLVSGDN